MPTYAYRCKNCEHQFEIIQKMSDEPLKECPECKGEVSRLLFPVGIVFRGSGFHVNDYPSSGSSKTESHSKTESPQKTEPSSDGGKEPAPKPEAGGQKKEEIRS